MLTYENTWTFLSYKQAIYTNVYNEKQSGFGKKS